MIIGVDIGNYATKSSKDYIFPSKCSTIGNIIKNSSITIDKDTFYIGEGSFDTEYRKTKKEFLRHLFLYSIALSNEQCVKAVVGLPLSQYREDKEALKNLLLSRRVNDIYYNNIPKKIMIDDVEVYPEGLGAISGTDYEGIIIDIGGRTTDVCQVIGGKVHNPYSLPRGTMNLYSEFIKVLNSKGLDLKMDDADRILKKGLRIDGEPVDINPAIEVFKQYVSELVNTLQLEYSLRTQEVLLIGGGCQLLYQAIKNRIPSARMINNPVFANAYGFKRVGEQIWQ